MARKKTIESEAITLTLEENGDFTCELRSNIGRYVRVAKVNNERSPELQGDDSLTSNVSIVDNLWLAAVAHLEAEELAIKEEELKKTKSDENEPAVEIDPEVGKDENSMEIDEHKIVAHKKKTLRKQAKIAADRATKLAELTDLLGDETKEGYCSSCLTLSTHRALTSKGSFMCTACGEATKKCTAVGCGHFGIDPLGLTGIAVLCAEHQHVIPNFEKLDHRIDDLTDYKELTEFRVMNVGRTAKIAAGGLVGLAVVGSAGLAAAPAIGGAVGSTFLGLSGAAATNAGLATLGFGSLAAGGFGMAGGTMVVAAAGALLGSAMGIGTLNAYLGEDDSFDIKKVRDGEGTPVIIVRGFTTEKRPDWRTEVAAAERAYPNSTIYLVEWGSKELKDLATFLTPAGGAGAAMMVKVAVKRASKKLAANVTPAGFALGLANLLSNPWHTAVNRANKTAMVLAAILQRTNMDECVLVGHSLGGRVVVNLCSAMAGVTNSERLVKIESAHVLGGAISRGYDWDAFESNRIGRIHNYYSNRDQVLSKLYPAAMPFQKAIGAHGFGVRSDAIVDHNVSEDVKGHSEYFKKVEFSRAD